MLLIMTAASFTTTTQTVASPIGGVVSDAVTGAPVRDVQVFVSGIGIAALTDSRGRFVLRAVPTGDQTVILSQENCYHRVEVSVPVSIEDVRLDIGLPFRHGQQLPLGACPR